MEWSPNPNALRGRLAVVAGATRSAGRGIAAALGEVGATVICTGRTTRSKRSEYNRAETIEETAEIMLEHFAVTEENWREAPNRTAPPGFANSESPRYVGRAIVALATDPNRARWNQRSVSSGELATTYEFTDLDGSRPDWFKP